MPRSDLNANFMRIHRPSLLCFVFCRAVDHFLCVLLEPTEPSRYISGYVAEASTSDAMLAALIVVAGVTIQTPPARSTAVPRCVENGGSSAFSRRAALTSAASAAGLILSPLSARADGKTPSGLEYKVVKAGKGICPPELGGCSPKVGDLIGIRFKGAVAATGAVFDDILESAEPYYTRVGSGNVLAAVDEAVKMMKTGDVWELTVPPELGFGKNGRSASPGKPRIPANAVISMTLELTTVPGKDDELIEANGILD